MLQYINKKMIMKTKLLSKQTIIIVIIVIISSRSILVRGEWNIECKEEYASMLCLKKSGI